MFNIDNIIRKNIKELVPYSSARSEFVGTANIWLDANENPYSTNLNRYPDPLQVELKNTLAKLKNVQYNQIFIGNGSDEAIDLLFRAFCEPGQDKAYLFPPTYGMYEVCAKINAVEINTIPLTQDFKLPTLNQITGYIEDKGIMFICSPNNPTGNVQPLEQIKQIADVFNGIVVVDEAYIDFSITQSATTLISTTPNLVVLQTLSKAFGLAGLRLGIAISNPEIIAILNKIKPPYNINSISQSKAIELLNDNNYEGQINEIITQREHLTDALRAMKFVKKVYDSEANFVLTIVTDADTTYNALMNMGIIVRNRTSQINNALRITVGTPEENNILISKLKSLT